CGVRRRFRHAKQADERDAVTVKAAHQRLGRSRPAYQQSYGPGKFPAPRISIERIENAEKNRWHAEAYRYALLLHQIKESLGVSEWPRQNDLCAGQGSSKRNPPSIGVKQRGHLQYRVPRRNGEGIDA